MNPRVDLGGVVQCGQCLGPLTPIHGDTLDEPPARWLWWRCEACGETTEALPIPPGYALSPTRVVA